MKTSLLRQKDKRVLHLVPSKNGKVSDTVAPLLSEHDKSLKTRHSTQTLTILFTDLVGSAALKSESGIHKAQTIELEHKRLLLESLRIIQKLYQDNSAQTIRLEGDSYIFVFSKSYEAVHFALLAQKLHREARTGQWSELPQFRVGIHTGEVIVEDGLKGPSRSGGIGDIKGLQADTTARIMGLASGGQILCSSSAFDNAIQSMTGVEIEEISDKLIWERHGFYRLKGREQPFEVCEVGEKSFAPFKKPVGNEKARRVKDRPLWFLITLLIISAMLWAYPKIISESPQPMKNNEKTVEELGSKVTELWGIFEALRDYAPRAAEDIRDKAPKYGHQLLDISDNNMNMPYIILKYQMAAFSLSMAAWVESDKSEKISFSNQAIEAGRKALTLMESVRNQTSEGNKQANKLHEWVESNYKKEVTHFVIAVCFAIKAQLGDQAAYEEVEKHLNSIPCSYQEKYPPKMDPHLKWYFENSPKKNSDGIQIKCSEGQNKKD